MTRKEMIERIDTLENKIAKIWFKNNWTNRDRDELDILNRELRELRKITGIKNNEVCFL